jgi:two-component system, OmpR family, alkaline phosphatase synthesis response regulator PhoP
MSGKLCLVEDDPTISQLVSEKLRSRGYEVELYDGAEPLLQKEDALGLRDLYILDILLKGDVSGLEVCRHLRKLSPTLPILILSALTEPSDRIEGLKCGADDYLPKPFEMEELLLRVDGMLKRRSWYGRLPEDQSIYVWDENSINFLELEGRRGYESFEMSQKECMLMKLLIERENAVVSRDEILDKVWGYNVFPSHRTVDNFIMRLRKYFEKEPRKPKFIHSVRGLGYKFTSKQKIGTTA